MKSGTVNRDLHVDGIAEALPQRSAALSRLFLRHSSICVSRTEVGVLRLLSSHPRRITDIAAEEHVTQPAITLLVNRLADRGWVERRSDPADRRAVLVSLTDTGAEVYGRLRAEYRAMLHEEMATLDDTEIATLAKAVEILDRVIARLEQREHPERLDRTDPEPRTS